MEPDYIRCPAVFDHNYFNMNLNFLELIRPGFKKKTTSCRIL